MGANGTTRVRERLEVGRVRRDFPVLRQKTGGHPLVYLDSASTAQKPRVVIDRVRAFYAAEYAKNDTPYRLGRHATDQYEASRAAAAKFLNAAKPEEIVFCRNTTEAINTVASGFSRGLLKSGDEILITELEHHSNIVPWHMACEQTGAKLRVAPLDADGDFDLDRSAGVAVRAGHLSCQPLMKKFGIGGAVRASFGVYNTPAEVDVLVEAVERCARRAGK